MEYVDLAKPKSEHLIAIIVHNGKKIKDNLFFSKRDHYCGHAI